MLKPRTPVGTAKSMRHLRVPSRETSAWRDKLSSNGWLSVGHGIHNLGEFRGIPLNENAPDFFEGFDIVEMEVMTSGPNHWTERLESDLFESYKEFWPMSHDQIGDVIIVKIPKEISRFSQEISSAMLNQHSSARMVCADNGVKGEFRVRDLEVLKTRSDTSTQTRVREHGNEFITDPGLVYYSPRLATERLETVGVAKKLSQKLDRKISVCDPYAGVGPAVVPLTKIPEYVENIFASDLNPSAAELLELNLPNSTTRCADARVLSEELGECCDLLLVNLPHETVDHLPHLIGLLNRGHEVVIRGWAILESDLIKTAETEIRHHLSECQVLSLEITPKKSYSSSTSYVSIEAHLIRD
ncbi:MAG: hypothetical protein ACPH87_07285 [Candidatus Poseidoniaceae archaeon]